MDIKKLANAKRVKVSFLQEDKINAEYIKEFRKKYELTQVALAVILGVKKKTIEKWEQGKNNVNGSSAVLLTLLNSDVAILQKCYSLALCNEFSDAIKFTTIKSISYVDNPIKVECYKTENFRPNSKIIVCNA